jgi:WhiB family transcriptional regulator, redox-sensing transcriptional regulator
MTDPATVAALVGGHGDWQADAACRGLNAALFFDTDTGRGRTKPAREAQAKAVCVTCPVLARCRDWALRVREPDGVWGGLSPAEREQLLLVRRIASAAPVPGRPAPASARPVWGRSTR